MNANNPTQHISWSIGILLALLVLTACTSTSPPSRFYVLTPVTQSADKAATDLTIGMGPVRLPAYLDRSQMVSHTGANQLKMDEFERWAGGLSPNINDVMAENLSRMLGTDQVVTHPWARAVPVQYQVMLDIRRFDVTPDNKVYLLAQWRLFTDGGKKLLQIKRAEFTQPISGSSYSARAAAQSDALAELGRQIADAIRQHAAAS
jgi:uncharacterized lipoprotein YmbA